MTDFRSCPSCYGGGKLEITCPTCEGSGAIDLPVTTAARKALKSYREYVETDDLEVLRLAMTDLEDSIEGPHYGQ
jgi:hypothetical protein